MRWVFQWLWLQTVFKHQCDDRCGYNSFIRVPISGIDSLEMNYPPVKKNQRVWNGKWYTTVACRGNLYYKLLWCTEAEPQIALSPLCLHLYMRSGYLVCVWHTFYAALLGGVSSFSVRKRLEFYLDGQLCACLHAAQHGQTDRWSNRHMGFSQSRSSAWVQFK